VPVQPHNDAGRSSTRPPEGVYRWGLMFRALWIAVFAPFLIGFLISGVLGHWVFLIAFAFWLGALACVLRAEALTMTPAPLGKQPATRPLRFFGTLPFKVWRAEHRSPARAWRCPSPGRNPGP
jgi:hypothetical protein